MVSPAIAGSASAAPPASSQMQDPTQQDASGDLTALAQQLRQVSQGVDDIAQANPDLADVMQQVKALLRQAIVKKANTSSMQTPSAMALPMAGS